MEQRANIKACFKLAKTFTETHPMMQQVHGGDCLSRTTFNEWFRRFKDGREHLTDDDRLGRPREAVNESNIEKVRQFIKNESKSSVRYMEIELNLSATSIYRILTLGLRKVCSRFVPHKLTDAEKALWIQHSKDIIKEAKKDRNFLYSFWFRSRNQTPKCRMEGPR